MTLRSLPAFLALPLAAAVPAGTWTLASAPDVAAIIEAATAPMNFVKRPIARSRLKKTNPVYRRIRIEQAGGEVRIQYDDRQPQRMPADGRAVAWTREDGDRFQIAARVEQGDLVQTYQAEDGQRRNVFHVDGAGQLVLKVQVTSAKLPNPVVYTIGYRLAD